MRHKLFIIIYAIFALITSGCGGGSSDSNNTQNKPPKVSVNSVTVQETQFVTLMATATDVDGVITSYRWRQTSGNTVSLNDATGETLSFHAPTISSEQTLKFDITVTDDKGAQASATATVNIVVNSAPVIDVSDIETAESTNVTITAMISDTDGTIKSIEWQQTEGPNVTATGLDSSVLSFASPSVSQDTLIRFSLTATDNLNKTTTQIVSILVKNSNLAPLVSVSDVSFFESEQVLISSSASDPDGSVEQYLWQQVSGITVALPITNEPDLKFIAPAVNKDETLSFRLTVSDNQNVSAAATADVLIKFNPAPVITVDDITTTENTLQTLTATVSDNGSISEINWRQTAGPTVNFVVTNPTSIEFTTPDVQSDTTLNFTVAATDNLGKTSEVTNQVLVTSRETSYTLKGKVIDSPVANAIVTTEINGVSFSTTANLEGEYELEILVGEEESSELVVLYASSPERPEIKLVSLLGTIEQLRDSANSDFVITREQLFAVNITNVTTAYYSLLYHANSGAYPADIQSAIRANLSTNGELLLPLATAIKLMLDFSSEEPGLALPSGYSDVMHWLEDRVASTSYVTRVSRSSYYKEALNTIIDSSDLVNKTVSADIAGHYFVKSTEINNVPAQLVLNDDATGSWHENARSAEFTWSTSADGLNLDFGWPGLEISTQPVSQFYGANATKYLRQAQLTLASESAVDIIFSAKLKHVTDPPTGIDVAPVEETLSSSFKAFKQSSLTDAFTALALEQEYVIPYAGINSSFSASDVFSNDSLIRAAKLRLSGDEMEGGNASLTVFDYSAPDDLLTSSSSHPWSINADGQIIVQVSATDSIEISLLAAEFSARSPLLSVRTKFSEQHFAITSNAVVNENQTWTNERIAGIYLLPENPARPQEFLWLELNPDGTALTVFHVDRNSDGEIIDSERQLMPGFWQIDDKGQLHVRRYRLRGGGYCEASTWQPLPTDDCQLYNNRIMLLQHLGPLSTQNEQEIGLIVDHRFYDSAFRGGSTGYPTLDYDLFAYGSFYGRIWKKVVERPVSID